MAEPVAETVGAQESASLEDKYWLWVKAEAAKIGSDACTHAKDWNVQCCYEHDLACHYKKDPKSAFQAYLKGFGMLGKDDVWFYAKNMSRKEADKAFTGCNLKYSKGPVDKARSFIRYIGVRIGAYWPF